jgi:hypothetical protein
MEFKIPKIYPIELKGISKYFESNVGKTPAKLENDAMTACHREQNEQ